jgi:hypothetical protein
MHDSCAVIICGYFFVEQPLMVIPDAGVDKMTRRNWFLELCQQLKSTWATQTSATLSNRQTNYNYSVKVLIHAVMKNVVPSLCTIPSASGIMYTN